MRSCAAALVVLAIVTECLSASDRSRKRSPVRSVPVAANLKRDVDFDCPEEFGYYSHPTDCTLYYVCVFGGALLESCTGGLMYSHELQTCDWPRNVGCDGASAVGGDELERISEREPPQRSQPRRKPPPPPPRAQPNPIVTSRGQPKFNRDEYEKQQQLYAEVDDLPPVEEIENDRQQRVYRGQPSTIGQVQKDRDGYSSQLVSSGRNFNTNIIPASISQNNGKIGSFSFGSQVDERRTATVTQAPQSYSLEPTESVAPLSYSPSPRPKMLYNGSQNYSPDQYDPFYAIYDEDGELYKDTDYVQQYNVASVQPAVQQTYRGTPPPARRPVDNYSLRPVPVSPDEYDDALIQGQINNHNQNQYQSPVRQPTRGEGNELGYEHIPSSVKTTIYEATPLSTIPTTTSTSTTTYRPTTAPYTEAMTPSRYTPRSSTDENPTPKSESTSNPNSSQESVSSYPSTLSPVINFSSLAKPFEKTDNFHSLDETLPTTEKTQILRRTHVTNSNNDKFKEMELDETKKEKKQLVSLTTGFSIRRNSNNINNPYTLTVLTRPLDEFGKNHRNYESHTKNTDNPSRYYYESSSDSNEKPTEALFDTSKYKTSSESGKRRQDSRYEISDDYDIPVYIRPKSRSTTKSTEVKSTTFPLTSTTKYYLKSVVKRPAPFSTDTKINGDSPEKVVDKVQNLIDIGLQNVESKIDNPSTTNKIIEITPKKSQINWSQSRWNEPTISPYKTLDNLRNFNKQDGSDQHSTTSTTSTTLFTTTNGEGKVYFKSRDKSSHLKPSYYSYKIDDEIVPDHTTEVFSSSVKNVIKAFFNNIVSTPTPQAYYTTQKPTSAKLEPKVVNIGYQKKPAIHDSIQKPLRHNVQRVEIITEPTRNKYTTHSSRTNVFNQRPEMLVNNDILTTTSTITSMNTVPYVFTSPATPQVLNNSFFTEENLANSNHTSKFSNFMSTTPNLASVATPELVESSHKFQHMIKEYTTSAYSKEDVDLNESIKSKANVKTTMTSEIEWNKPQSEILNEIFSTTSTTKSTTTTTAKSDPTTTKTTKSVSYPTRASRVNPAIKLAASIPGSGRRSYQSSSKCSSDNSLQANPKCNEIKYQRYITRRPK